MNDAKIQAIAGSLGWKTDPRYDDSAWCFVLTDGERSIHFNATTKRGRYDISGCWPWDNDRCQHAPSNPKHITVGQDRTPDEIAAEIKRRFLPWYMAEHEKQLAAAKVANQRANSIEETRQKLIALGLEGRHSTATLYGPGCTYFDVQGPDSIRVECRGNFSLKTAKKLPKSSRPSTTNTMKYAIHNDELVAFYNVVEQHVIDMFGSYERAASYFDTAGSLDELWMTTEACYRGGWSAEKTARMWFVNARPTPLPKPAEKPAPITRSSWSRTPVIEPEVLAKRAARRKKWQASQLIPF